MKKEKLRNSINKTISESSKIILESSNQIKEIEQTIEKITKCLKNGKKIIIFGNGGSAADAQHMAAEFIGRYLKERQSYAAIALTTDSSILTALGNDYSFDIIFSRQCEALVNKGDLVIGISTSGNSQNVINGIKTSKKNGAITVSLTGGNGGKLKKFSDYSIISPSSHTPHIQESHRIIIHIICNLVEKYSKN